MKKILFSGLLYIIALNAYAQGGQAGGTIMNKNCEAFGFNCKTNGINGIQKMKPGLTPLALSFNAIASVLTITLLQDDVDNTNSDALNYLRTHSAFTCDETVPIADAVCHRLQLPLGTVIPPGTYKINRRGDAFIITIPLKNL